MRKYYVYILTNRTKTVLYTGVTNNLQQRLDEHLLAENPSAFTARYNVNKLLYFEEYQDIRDAIAREKEIKGWRRVKKERLIETTNPYWQFLNKEEI